MGKHFPQLTFNQSFGGNGAEEVNLGVHRRYPSFQVEQVEYDSTGRPEGRTAFQSHLSRYAIPGEWMECLRFALLFNGSTLERWHLRCLDYLEESAKLTCIIVAADRPNSSTMASASALMRLYARSLGNKQKVNVTQRLANIARFRPSRLVEPGELDFILKLGRGSIPAGMALTARHGVWCFQHETEDNLLPFFREVYDAEDVTEAALLAHRGPGGDAAILEQGHFRTEKRSYVESRNRVLNSIAEWPARVCRRLVREDGDAALPTVGTVRLGRSDCRPQFLRFWARIARRRFDFASQRLFRHPQWNIGVLPFSVAKLLQPGNYSDAGIEWFPLDHRKSFLADPFGVVRGGTIHILCESFRYRSGKGHICALTYSHHRFTTQPEPAIELPVHMSYPFLVEDAGQIYCVPEASAADEVALFRAVEFPHKWSRVAVLVERFGGVDPTVFRYDGRWWLMCTEKGRNADVELWIWHASDLLGPWTPHAQNPVKTDVRTARPGGAPFVHEGVLYRPAQDCSKTYGWRIVIQRVKTLTPSEFVEEPMTVLEASADSPFPLGRHTLSSVGEVVLIDGHRTVFVWQALWSFFKILMQPLWSKLRPRRSTRR
jgi:hypothetical protein